MEISLKVELTDEQYADLMQSSYDEIFKSQEMQDALREIVLKEFSGYFNKENTPSNSSAISNYSARKSLVEKVLLDENRGRHSYNSYTDYVPSELMKKLILEATEAQLGAFRNRIRMVTADLLSDERYLAQCLHTIMVESMRIGISMGNTYMAEDTLNDKNSLEMVKNSLSNIQSKMFGN